MRHWYKKNWKSYCGANLKPDSNYIGYMQINDCDCLKCLQRFVKLKNNRVGTLETKSLAQKRITELTFVKDFDTLINEE